MKKTLSLWQANIAEDFSATSERLKSLKKIVQVEVAEQIVEVLNREIEKRPKETLVEKQELCKWVNAELRVLGLAILCPKTGQAGILHADSGHIADEGRFQIELLGTESGRKRSFTSRQIWPVKLTAAPLRTEPLAGSWMAKRLKGGEPLR